MQELEVIIGNNLERLQRERNLSNKTLAKRVCVSVRQLSRYKNMQCKNITLSKLEELASALDVDIVELITKRDL